MAQCNLITNGPYSLSPLPELWRAGKKFLIDTKQKLNLFNFFRSILHHCHHQSLVTIHPEKCQMDPFFTLAKKNPSYSRKTLKSLASSVKRLINLYIRNQLCVVFVMIQCSKDYYSPWQRNQSKEKKNETLH